MGTTARELGLLLASNSARIAVAESCTGGLVSKTLTDVAGSSVWFERGLVTYSNAAKTDLLGVSPDLLARHGAVSRECAAAMARGLLVMTPADFAVAITGIAGPGGGTKAKPVGLVWVAWAKRGGRLEVRRLRLKGSRGRVRSQATDAALRGAMRLARRG